MCCVAYVVDESLLLQDNYAIPVGEDLASNELLSSIDRVCKYARTMMLIG